MSIKKLFLTLGIFIFALIFVFVGEKNALAADGNIMMGTVDGTWWCDSSHSSGISDCSEMCRDAGRSYAKLEPTGNKRNENTAICNCYCNTASSQVQAHDNINHSNVGEIYASDVAGSHSISAYANADNTLGLKIDGKVFASYPGNTDYDCASDNCIDGYFLDAVINSQGTWLLTYQVGDVVHLILNGKEIINSNAYMVPNIYATENGYGYSYLISKDHSNLHDDTLAEFLFDYYVNVNGQKYGPYGIARFLMNDMAGYVIVYVDSADMESDAPLIHVVENGKETGTYREDDDILFDILDKYIDPYNFSYLFEAADAKVISEIKQTQTALELYWNDAGQYPEKINFGGPIAYNGITYMAVVPQGDDTNYPRSYTRLDKDFYSLDYYLIGDTDNSNAGWHTACPYGYDCSESDFNDTYSSVINETDVNTEADIHQIQAALELYYNYANQYPEKINFGQSLSYNGTDYLSAVTQASDKDHLYVYTRLNKMFYTLSYYLVGKVRHLAAGNHIACPEGFSCSEKDINKHRNFNSDFTKKQAGKILLQVEGNGEAWYVDPTSLRRYYLKDGNTAYNALREFGLGITNADLSKIPVGIEDRAKGVDSDNDGLDDKTEDALGTNSNDNDSDNDGYNDGTEVKGNYNPRGNGNMARDNNLISRMEGKILLQVEGNGEAWYVHNGKRYYMANGDFAYQIMRFLSLGITNANLNQIEQGSL